MNLIKPFWRREAEVLNHWFAFVDAFQTSSDEFYAAIEKQLTELRVPNMKMSRVELPEGGLLSEKRVYLRMLRERMVFDVCAAPFGTGFFFSCRTAEIPLVLNLWQLATVMVILFTGLYLFLKLFGFWLGMVVAIIVLVGGIYVLRNAVAMGLQDLDRTLLQSPVIGSVYEVLFRKETYHRYDSRVCYLYVVPTLVKQLAETTAAAKGIHLMSQYELSPVLGDLYKPSLPTIPPEPPPV